MLSDVVSHSFPNGWADVDSVHGDAIAYNIKFAKDVLPNMNPFAIFICDVVHRLDGLLEAQVNSENKIVSFFFSLC